ncbi:MAG: helix-turn-helix transcriptional regulator [Candidatus Eremiobacteraeota bacterium]|nr:helix-turn-helix transcriptional regulator [Candidatus Eremiobacteraeota bacterium]MBC5826379.1 helix-turn-helix transcriptional regulator [Candidatus Eremiobacteraeota bacterium]
MASKQSTATLKQGTSKGRLSGFCPRFHHAVELVGRRWTGAILRALIAGPRRFNELLHTVPGLSDRLLSERLRELEAEGLLGRSVAAGPPVSVHYELTKAGHSLEPVIEAISEWAERWISV